MTPAVCQSCDFAPQKRGFNTPGLPPAPATGANLLIITLSTESSPALWPVACALLAAALALALAQLWTLDSQVLLLSSLSPSLPCAFPFSPAFHSTSHYRTQQFSHIYSPSILTTAACFVYFLLPHSRFIPITIPLIQAANLSSSTLTAETSRPLRPDVKEASISPTPQSTLLGLVYFSCMIILIIYAIHLSIDLSPFQRVLHLIPPVHQVTQVY